MGNGARQSCVLSREKPMPFLVFSLGSYVLRTASFLIVRELGRIFYVLKRKRIQELKTVRSECANPPPSGPCYPNSFSREDYTFTSCHSSTMS